MCKIVCFITFPSIVICFLSGKKYSRSERKVCRGRDEKLEIIKEYCMTLKLIVKNFSFPFLFSIFLRTKNKMFNNSQKEIGKNNMPWVKS